MQSQDRRMIQDVDLLEILDDTVFGCRYLVHYNFRRWLWCYSLTRRLLGQTPLIEVVFQNL